MSYTVINPHPSIPIIANVPHSSSFIPAQIREQFIISDQALIEEQRLLVDWFTDQLYAPIVESGGCIVRHDVSRFVLDPERFEDDAQESMAARGMGVLYTHGCNRQKIRRELRPEEREALLEQFYRPYHAELITLVNQTIARFGHCFVFDCHSYPAAPLPYEIDGEALRPDLVLGTDTHHTPQHIVHGIKEIVLEAGYSFGLDRPFSGTYVPLPLYRDKRVTAFMLEVNRSTYMNEATTERSANFDCMLGCIRRIVDKVIQPAI